MHLKKGEKKIKKEKRMLRYNFCKYVSPSISESFIKEFFTIILAIWINVQIDLIECEWKCTAKKPLNYYKITKAFPQVMLALLVYRKCVFQLISFRGTLKHYNKTSSAHLLYYANVKKNFQKKIYYIKKNFIWMI